MTGTIKRGKVIRADFANWDGVTSTYSRPDTTGGTTSGLAIGNEVDVLQVYGSGTDRDRASIVAAMSRISTTAVTLLFSPGTWTITTSLTIASNFTCRIPAGCVFSISSGATLTFSGPVFVESGTWYTGSGTVSPTNDRGNVFRTTAEISAGVVPTNFAYPEFHTKRYGAAADGVTDDTAALQSLASVVRQADGAYVQFESRKTYAVWPLGTGSTLLDFTNANGVTVDGNGSVLSAGAVSGTTPIVFDLDGAAQIRISNLNYTQSYQTLDPDNGAILFNMEAGTSGVTIQNISQTGGLRGIHCLGTLAAGGAAASNITALNCSFTSVYYPQQFRMSGNNYFARGIRTINCGRGYFPFNVYNHDVVMYSEHGGAFDDVLLKNYTYTAEYNALRDIKLVYYTDGRNASASAQQSGNALIALEFQLVDTTAGDISNIDITMMVTATASDNPTRGFIIRKFLANGSPDTTARGHLVTNLKLSGHFKNWENASGTCIDIFSTSGYTWSGDFAKNISIHDLCIEDSAGTNSSILINGQPFAETAGITLRDVQVEGDITRSNWDAEFPFNADSVQAQNLVIQSAWKDYTPTWSSSGTQPTVGNGTITGKYRRSGDWITANVVLTTGGTSTFGTGTYSFSLPKSSANEAHSSWGSGLIVDITGNRYVLSSEVVANASNARLWADATAGPVAATVPITFAAGDIIYFQVTYFADWT